MPKHYWNCSTLCLTTNRNTAWSGFIHKDKEVIEKVFDNDTTVKQLLITKDMYFNKKESGNYE